MEIDLGPGPIHGVSVNVAVRPLAGEIMSGSDMLEQVPDSLKPMAMAMAIETEVSPTSSEGDVTASQNGETVIESNISKSPFSIPTMQLLTKGLNEPHAKSLVDMPVLSPGKNDKEDTVAKGHITTKVPTATVDKVFLPSTILKRRLEDTKDLLVCPGVYDGFSARIALSVGFDAMYMVSSILHSLSVYANSNPPDRRRHHRLSPRSARSWPRTTQRYACPRRHDRQSRSLRHTSDRRHGHGLRWCVPAIPPSPPPPPPPSSLTPPTGPNTIALAVRQYIRANVAGFHIEDQVLTKRCGHLSGKRVVSADVYLSRIRAAKAAKDKAHSDIVLIARTDANQQLGYDECIARLRAARALGADVGLLEGFKSKEQAAQAVKDLAPWPLLLNIVENGHSPLITVEEAREMGFRIMIFSFAALAPAYSAIKDAYEKLKWDGVTGIQGSGVTPKGIFEVCGLGECMRVDEEAGGEDFKGGV